MLERPHPVHVFINRTKYELDSAIQTGAALKTIAGLALTDVLFLQQPGDDAVIPNETSVTLKNGSQLHSQPPADYGLGVPELVEAGLNPDRVRLVPEGGWTLLVIEAHQLPEGFAPQQVDLLVKLPPTFPDAAPDMFWLYPAVVAPTGVPRGTSPEQVLGKEWQRFSWHLAPGAWKPGVSTLRDYMRCITSRFLRLD